MNILLDTHVALWAITDDERLSPRARDLIVSPGTKVWISAASLWEIAIKHGLGRGGMPISAQQALSYFDAAGYSMLAIQVEHVLKVALLPAHHQDPFDRVLVAQALTESMQLLTHDKTVAQYSRSIIEV